MAKMKVATLERLGEFLTECKALFASQTEFNSYTEQVDNDFAAVNGRFDNTILKVVVSTDSPFTTMSNIITAIEAAGGDINAINFVQLTGYLTDNLLIQMQSYGGSTYKVTCVNPVTLAMIYNAETDNVINVSTTRIQDFLSSQISVNEINEKTIDKIKEINLWNGNVGGLSAKEGGISWQDSYKIAAADNYTGTGCYMVPIVAGNNVTFEVVNEPYEVVKINATGGSSLPSCDITDEGKFLRVVGGVAVWQSITNAEETSF